MSRVEEGALPSGWVWVRLGDLGKWVGGGTPDTSKDHYWRNGTIPWVSPKDMKTSRIVGAEDTITPDALAGSATNLVPRGSVLIVTRSGILRHSLPVAFTDVDVTLNQDLKALVPRAGLNPAYIALAVRRFARDILKDCAKHGTTVQSIEQARLLDFQLPIAPAGEQRRIVARVDELFSKLDAAEAALLKCRVLLSRYQEVAIASAVTGRLETTSKEGPLPSSGNPNGTLIESGVEPYADLPSTWNWRLLNDVVDQVASALTDGPFGSNLKTSHYRSSGARVIRLENIGDGFFVDKETFINMTHYESLRKHRAVPGDIVIASLGDKVPRATMVPDDLGPAIVKADCIKLSVDRRKVLPEYVTHCLNAEPLRNRVRNLIHGVGRPRLGLKLIRELPLPVPPLAVQKKVCAGLQVHLDQSRQLREQVDHMLSTLTQMRQSILSAAFAGKLTLQEQGDEPTIALLRWTATASGETPMNIGSRPPARVR